MGQPGAGAGLIESGHQGLFLEQIGILPVPGDGFKFFCDLEDTEEFVSLEVF